MQLGQLRVDVISDGMFKMDGGALFGLIPKDTWQAKSKADRRNRVTLGLNCLLIQSAQGVVLVDTGVGSSAADATKDQYGLSTSKLLRSMRSCGVSPRDVDLVVLTHLHFDHSGGMTRLDRTGEMIPTFPRATYVVQQAAWEEAKAPTERSRRSFHKNLFTDLEKNGRVRLVTGDTELIPNVHAYYTGGHARGHQVVTVKSNSEKLVFLGDLVPTSHHLDLSYISAVDYSPEETLEQKRRILNSVAREGWMVIFSHDNAFPSGYVDQRNGSMRFRPVNF